MGSYHFFAIMGRMKYINRWSLMNNTRQENISEHSLTVAMLAHVLTIISNKRLGNHFDAEHAAAIALFHDCTEIITGDLPTPIKYASKTLRNAYKDIEEEAAQHLLGTLPDDLREEYEKLLLPKDPKDAYLLKLVKAADRLSALIKCIEEEQMGNREFMRAKTEILTSLRETELTEVSIFLQEFLPSYALSLDEQNFTL
ncbi:MAG: 5'-deoxynucleotidase [Acutalibacteraceae bacterium]|nr:5'-deoxynucleotidase [Clostridia bacterium]MEE3403751.1 5'-deoxynucleotidase [Acutalibacteraceae bacterium]HCA55232.1 5'-deoxynucleotidase [Oscillospiraceae bacterium]